MPIQNSWLKITYILYFSLLGSRQEEWQFFICAVTRFENLKYAIFWNVTLCGSCKILYFGGLYYLSHQKLLCNMLQLIVTANIVPNSLIFSPWSCRRYVPLKHWFIQEPHGITSNRMAFFIVTATKTSNLTLRICSEFGYEMYLCIFVNVARYVCVKQTVSYCHMRELLPLFYPLLILVYAKCIEISDMKFVLLACCIKTNKKKTPWPLVRERTIPTDRPPLVDEI
jgi:hypothetical protein